MRLVIYEALDRPSRKIIRTFSSCPASMADIQAKEGEEWMLGDANLEIDYIAVDHEGIPTVTPRPEMSLIQDKPTIAADAEDVCTITGIPESCIISHNGQSVAVNGGTLEFVTDQVGKHTLRFELFPYLDAEVTIHAT